LIKALPVASVLELISTYANVASVLVTVLQNLSSSSNLCSVWSTGSMAAVYTSYSIMLSFILGRICREAHDMFCWLESSRCSLVSLGVRNNHPSDSVVLRAVAQLCNQPNVTAGQEICQLHTCMTDSETRYIAEWTVPERLGSSLLSIGHLLLFLSLGNAFEMHKITGVLTFTVQKMFKDIGQFFVFMALVLLGFGSALTTMYQNFRCSTTAFDSFPNTTNVLYWGIYAMSDTTAYNLLNNKLSSDSVTQFIRSFGLFLYGGYILIASVVAVNLLIALMSVTFEDIQANKNDKWLFGRMRRQLKLILLRPYHSLVLPIPLNLLTPLPQTLLAIAWAVRWVLRRCLATCRPESSSTLQLQLEQQPEKELEEMRAADLQYITSHVQRRTTVEKCLVKLRIKYKLCEYSKEALKANRLSLSMLEDQEELMEIEEEEEEDDDEDLSHLCQETSNW
uniref:Ion_trans domain-containing protein n=1 Tax=Macrostomum lignano TaxID=282301 RepID=A0A1I8HPM4_9PLAT